MKHILLDTNFFFVPFQMGVNIFSEIERIVDEPLELFTLSSTIGEIERVAKSGKGDDKASAKLALQLAKNLKIIDTPNSGDAAILAYAKVNTDVIVATNDSELRKKLKAAKTRTIFLRGKNKLEIG